MNTCSLTVWGLAAIIRGGGRGDAEPIDTAETLKDSRPGDKSVHARVATKYFKKRCIQMAGRSGERIGAR